MIKPFAETINDFANNSKGIQAVETPKSEKRSTVIVLVATLLLIATIIIIRVNN